eukprot:gnl/TRDRNA2_/TRDRNA2_68391_c0_seq1.p1 gnl/TRDRNA2_/TRDRNA2_68391_c0~~gnl/TRDRNA2_/TRDRNA2_68391_c0_seq1.p1  ORF type:complete len:515 (+),score=81.63 gnl/TRDRNA2_/TRDRNA2_68391_c0_seq1:74-1618(+)
MTAGDVRAASAPVLSGRRPMEFEDGQVQGADEDDMSWLLKDPSYEPEIWAEDLIFNCLPPLHIAYGICLAMIAEGLFGICNVHELIERENGLFQGLNDHNPFAHGQWAIMAVVSYLDIFLGAVALSAYFIATTEFPIARKFWPFRYYMPHASTALLAWRALVLLIIAPWVGIMLAFEPPHFDKTSYIFCTFVYITGNGIVIYMLMQIVSWSRQETVVIERALREESHVQRQALMRRAQTMNYPEYGTLIPADGEGDFTLFGCLPLEETVTLYTFLGGLASLVWFIEIATYNRTVGGWAWTMAMPKVDVTYGLETVVYFLSFIFCAAAIMGIFFFHSARDLESMIREELVAAGSLAYSEQLDEAMKSKKRCVLAVLLYLLFSIFRFAVFFPITGMALVEKDVCGLYVHGLSSTALYRPVYGLGVPMHCTKEDFGIIAATVVTFAVDAYFIYGIYRLWLWQRTEFSFALPGPDGKRYGYYGSLLSPALPITAPGQARYVSADGVLSAPVAVKEATL